MCKLWHVIVKSIIRHPDQAWDCRIKTAKKPGIPHCPIEIICLLTAHLLKMLVDTQARREDIFTKGKAVIEFR